MQDVLHAGDMVVHRHLAGSEAANKVYLCVLQVVLEGPGVNTYVSGPAAAIALMMMYLKTGDAGIAAKFKVQWLTILSQLLRCTPAVDQKQQCLVLSVFLHRLHQQWSQTPDGTPLRVAMGL